MKEKILLPDLLHKIDAYWRAANYLSVGQIYLYDNPLLKQPLDLSHVKPMVIGHWGTTPGQNFIYVHLNRVIKKYDLNMFYVSGPGHGAPALVKNKIKNQQLILIFIAQCIFNLLWSPIFFYYQSIGWALLDICALWLSLVAFMFAARNQRVILLLFFPYFFWVTFALILNLSIYKMNI